MRRYLAVAQVVDWQATLLERLETGLVGQVRWIRHELRTLDDLKGRWFFRRPAQNVALGDFVVNSMKAEMKLLREGHAIVTCGAGNGDVRRGCSGANTCSPWCCAGASRSRSGIDIS